MNEKNIIIWFKKKIESKIQQAHIKKLLAKNVPFKVLQSVITTVNTCGQKMIKFGKENKKINNQDKWNYCYNFPLLLFLGVNHCIPLLNMSKSFVYLHNTEERIYEFLIGYMVNRTLHVNKAFK